MFRKKDRSLYQSSPVHFASAMHDIHVVEGYNAPYLSYYLSVRKNAEVLDFKVAIFLNIDYGEAPIPVISIRPIIWTKVAKAAG